MAEKKIKAYIRRLECSVCLDIFKDPRILPCAKGGHSVCKNCLQQLVRESSITCPLCRMQHPVPEGGVDNFPPNLMASDMIDTLCGGCRKAEPEVHCPHCGKETCLACQISHMTFQDATEWLKELDKTMQEAEQVGNITDIMKATVMCKRIDDAADVVFSKLEDRKNALKDQVRRAYESNADILKTWKEAMDAKTSEAQAYLEVSRKNLAEGYSNIMSHQELTDMKTWCQGKVKEMKADITQAPVIAEPVLEFDDTAALSAISSFGSVHAKAGTTEKLLTRRYKAKPKVIGQRGPQPGQFSCPLDVAVCPVTSHVVVADAENKRVQILTSDFRHVTDIRRGRQSQELNRPAGVAVNSRGDIIVTDREAHAVFVYTQDGVYSRQLPGPWSEPWGVVIDSDNVTYICDSGTHSIKVVDQSGKLVSTIGSEGSGPGQFSRPPWYITIYNDNLHVSDTAGRVYVFTKSGTFLKHGDSAIIAEARGLAVLGSEYLVIVDYKDSIAVMRDDKLICRIGESGSQSDQLNAPYGVTVSKTGQIIVANWGLHNILVFDPSE